jgi:ABC-2 type transport system ATP-binding protein
MEVKVEKILKIDGVTKKFRHPMRVWEQITAVDSISCSIDRGEIIGFVGHNGAGKTTTIRMMMGFIAPTSGSISLFGCDPGDPVIKQKIGFLPERPYFYTQLTARELLRYFGSLSGMEKGKLKDAVEKNLKRVGLQDAADRKLSSFSKGMLQRIGIAQAIVHDPEFVVMDEPMSGLDPSGRKEVKALIRELKNEGKTVLFSSHILEDIENLSEKVLIIDHGKIRSFGSIKETLSLGETSYKIIFSAPDNVRDSLFSKFKGMKVISGLCHLQMNTESEMNKTLAEIISLGYQVHQAAPQLPSLEDIVFSTGDNNHE